MSNRLVSRKGLRPLARQVPKRDARVILLPLPASERVLPLIFRLITRWRRLRSASSAMTASRVSRLALVRSSPVSVVFLCHNYALGASVFQQDRGPVKFASSTLNRYRDNLGWTLRNSSGVGEGTRHIIVRKRRQWRS